MSKEKLILLSRPSKLAQIQVSELMGKFPELEYELRLISSYGDKHKEISLLDNKESDFFTRELDEALLEGLGDAAVHSAKDLPFPLPDGLEMIALFEALDKTDALISKDKLKIHELPAGSVIGTSSQERKLQLEKLRPDLKTLGIRGTIEERIEQVHSGKYDGLIVATCALIRLNKEHLISEILPFKAHPLQGNLALISKKGNMNLPDRFRDFDITKRYGKVFLAGAGPGKYEWLTIQALKAIEQADVLVYDDLIDKQILEHSVAEKIYVGKRPGQHTFEQEEINEIIFNYALSGKNIVRLKGGDPMIFGHAGEEIAFLESRFVNVEVIPGITSALGAAALSKIPLTMRNLSSSVAFCTAHSAEFIEIPDAETLVFYMGAANVQKIARMLIIKNWPESTPLKIVYNIGSASESVYSETIESILSKNEVYKSPLILIAGKTASRNNWNRAFEKSPKILYTGTHFEKYKHLGKVKNHPLIQICALTDYSKIDEVILNINAYNYLIFTSVYSVYYFFERMKSTGKDSRILSTNKIISIGNYTSSELDKYGIIPDLQSQTESSEGIIEMFKTNRISKTRILIPRSNTALAILPEGLIKLGNYVQCLEVYQNKMPDNIEKVNLDEFDQLLFTSPSGVNNFLKLYGTIPKNKKLIAKGPETQKALDACLKSKHLYNYI